MEEKFIEKFKEALEMEEEEVKMEDNFRDYVEWDSLSRLSVIAMLDEEFEVQIEEADFDQLKTVGDLLAEVKKRSATT